MAIDFFFRSLAEDCGNRAIGIVLSGTANDGTEGLRAIKSENGVTFAQDPKSAKFTGMPQSAVDAEVVDFCLSIPKLALELVRLAHHPFIAGSLAEPLFPANDDRDLQKIFVLLRASTGVDYSEYKPPTIKRRLARRMALLKTDTLKDYIKYLQDTPEEIKALGSDVLIHVTSFFRDPEVYKKLHSTIFPELIKHKAAGAPIRIWVTGCSSGEEVYSIAISILEFLGEDSPKHPIQLFGSDISERMIEKARIGLFNESAMLDMEPKRLKRFFIKAEGGYKISKLVRDLCVFVRHDLAKDPPFSKLDLVTCRNVLIYFEAVLQKRIISTFHYCLNQPGFLLLGRTESISSQQHLFTAMDKTNKIFSRAAVTSHLKFVTMQNTSMDKISIHPTLVDTVRPVFDIGKQIDGILLSRYSPAGVLINEQMEIIQYRGKTSTYLEAPAGQPQLNLFKLIREGLFASLKVAIVQAKKLMAVVQKEGLEFKQNGVPKMCNLVVIPVSKLPGSKEPLFLVLFEEVALPQKSKISKGKIKLNKRGKEKEENASQRAGKLEHELRSTQEYLQTLNEEHQKTNDSLNSLNEEFVSGNEELQSMNEELETAKEELQSTNEELTTVNDELQNRNQDTAQINDDLINLLNSAEIPIVILDLQRRIRRFTPKARKIMNLLPTDIGRQIDDIKPNFKIEHLDEQIKQVIETAQNSESEVQDQEGKWQRLQIRPYKTIDNKIDGAVLSLTNIDALKREVIDAKWVRDYSANIVEAVQTPLIVLDDQLKVLSANEAYYEFSKRQKTDIEGKCIYDLNTGKWKLDELKSALSEMLEKKTSFRNMKITSDAPENALKVFSLSARPIQCHDSTVMILLAVEDITERSNREQERRKLLDEAQKANLTKDLFLATLSHELRTPLTSMILQSQMLQRGGLDEAKTKKASISIERAARTQAQLIEDLLDVSRIVTGKLKMELKTVNLVEVIEAALETVAPFADSKSILIESHLDNSVGEISGDPVRLQQVIWNLLTNAVKFTAKGGDDKVIVSLKSVDGHAQIQVVDTGMGIDPEFLPQVFNRFTQAETTDTRTHGGLGLGLAIVRHLVEIHGGTVKVESPGKGKGATFTVTLPFIEEIAQEFNFGDSSTNTSRIRGSRKGSDKKLIGLKVLVVDDDFGVREALVEMLNLAGAEVRDASCANEAMKVLNDFIPDEMVLDIAMPIENGYSLLNRIRKLVPKAKCIPALALTALASDKDRDDALAAGFQMHLVKPVDISRLTGALLDLSELDHIIH